MLPREMGGVVDKELRVYGTVNLRVVDTSIYPLLPASHLQSVVYAVAEKAADIIKAEASEGKEANVDVSGMRACHGKAGVGPSMW